MPGPLGWCIGIGGQGRRRAGTIPEVGMNSAAADGRLVMLCLGAEVLTNSA